MAPKIMRLAGEQAEVFDLQKERGCQHRRSSTKPQGF